MVEVSELVSTTFGANNQLISTTFGIDNQLISTTFDIKSQLNGFTQEFVAIIVSTTFGTDNQLISTTFGADNQLISTTFGIGNEIISTTIAFQTAGFISSPNLLSTVDGLGSAGYLSTQISSFLTLSTGFITTSTLGFYDSMNNNLLNNVYVKNTYLYFNDYVVGGATQLQPQIFNF